MPHRPSSEWGSLQDVSDAFHISIAWKLEPPNQELIDFVKKEVEKSELVKQIDVRVDEIKAKLGNVVMSISLPKNVVEDRGFYEL